MLIYTGNFPLQWIVIQGRDDIIDSNSRMHAFQKLKHENAR